MNDLERAEIYVEIEEHLDKIDEIMEDHDVDVESDDAFSEVADFVQRIRTIITEE